MKAVAHAADRRDAGRAAFRQRRWREARDLLAEAESEAPLAPADYELLATAEFMTSPDAAGLDVWERAHHVLLERGDTPRSVRAAFWLGLNLMNRGEEARGGGWLARAQRLLDESGIDSVEQGYMLLPAAIRAIRAGDAATSLAIHEQVIAIARRFGDEDLLTFARMGVGRSLLASGDLAAGQAVMDEVMVAITTGSGSPLVVGIVYCSVITGLRQVYDIGRAREWTLALERWCESQPELQMYRGECLVFRAEVLQHTGDWENALEGMVDARTRLVGPPPHPAAGTAAYREGELHRFSGRYAEAEEAYARASELGRSPQPGLALLRLGQGRTRVAEASVRRALAETAAMTARAELLPGYVEVMLAAADLDAAEAGAAELAELATAADSDFLAATARQFEGATLLARARPAEALNRLREAAATWQKLDAAHQLARTRVLVARACRELGDGDAAGLEIEAARKTFIRLGANPDLAALDAAVAPHTDPGHKLSNRELEVARLVAAGLSNKAIAEKLFLSERTAESHVKHICDKLGFNSRAQVAAWVTSIRASS